jgi:hypothetical protein
MDDNFVVRRGVEDQVGIRVNDDAAKAADVREPAGIGMQSDEVHDGLNPRFDVIGALRRVLLDMRQDLIEFFSGAKRVP